MPVLKYSRQRECIKNFLISRYDHPTADTIYMNVREEFPNISLGTVYRNLALLTELGEVLKISGEDGADRFDGHPEPHSHFLCKKCHAVLDIKMKDESFIDTEAKKYFPGAIESHTLLFQGVCQNCLENV